MKTLLLLCAFLALTQGRQLLSEKPEGPSYKVINSTDSLELRAYDNATWAVAFGRSRWSIDLASFYAGKALVAYFSGANVAHTAIKPTVPLIATILLPPHHKHGNGSHPHPPHPPHKNDSHPHPPHKNESHPHPPHHPPHPPHHPPGPPAVALAAYIPSKFEGDAPIPDCPHVKILHTNKTDVYVHKFGGWALSFVVKHEIGHLALALKDAGICPFSGKFFVATYQGPFQVFGRRNEILWVKKPHHKHHNETEAQAAEWDFEAPVGLGALDVEALFPEEFPVDEEFPPMEEEDFVPAPHTELPQSTASDAVEATQQAAALDAVQVS